MGFCGDGTELIENPNGKQEKECAALCTVGIDPNKSDAVLLFRMSEAVLEDQLTGAWPRIVKAIQEHYEKACAGLFA